MASCVGAVEETFKTGGRWLLKMEGKAGVSKSLECTFCDCSLVLCTLSTVLPVPVNKYNVVLSLLLRLVPLAEVAAAAAAVEAVAIVAVREGLEWRERKRRSLSRLEEEVRVLRKPSVCMSDDEWTNA